MREFLTEALIEPPTGTPREEVDRRVAAEGERAAELAASGRLLRAWRPEAEGWRNILLWQADDEAALAVLIDSLPLREWMTVQVRPLREHPSDPARSGT